VRLGLVRLVAGQATVVAGQAGLPETLRRDVDRLDAGQTEFQRLLVTAACLLVINAVAAQQQPPRRLSPGTLLK
jgi:T-complex protein 11